MTRSPHQSRVRCRRGGTRTPARARQGTATTRRCGDRGSASLELAILAPALVLALLLAIGAGRITTSHQAVEAAARDAARQASIARDPTTAQANATTSAHATLAREGLTCPARVTVDVSQFARTVGQPGTVTATVACTVRLADVAASGIPAATVTGRYTSPIDPHRGRTP